MAIVGLSLEATRSYQSKLDPDRGKKGATTFQIGTLDSRISGKVKDMATSIEVDPNQMDDEVTTSINQNEVYFAACQYGLKGWENFRDAKNNDIPFKVLTRRHSGSSYEIVDPEVLKLVPQVVLQELAQEIMKDNDLTEAEGNGSA